MSESACDENPWLELGKCFDGLMFYFTDVGDLTNKGTYLTANFHRHSPNLAKDMQWKN